MSHNWVDMQGQSPKPHFGVAGLIIPHVLIVYEKDGYVMIFVNLPVSFLGPFDVATEKSTQNS